jgi:hypothetical protein
MIPPMDLVEATLYLIQPQQTAVVVGNGINLPIHHKPAADLVAQALLEMDKAQAQQHKETAAV